MNSQARFVALGCMTALGLAVTSPAPAADPTGEIVGTVTGGAAKNRANTIIYLKDAGLGTSIARATMDQRGMVFAPRVLPVQKGTTVEFLNSDQTGHNVFTPDNEAYDLGTWPTGEVRSHKFEKTGVYRQLCRVHDDMIAYIVVLDGKYFAVSDKKGQFKLSNVPPGRYTVGVWNEKLSAPDATVEVTAGQAAPLTITLRPRS